ncbi:MAG: hypothetical protein HKN42_17810 [Granulosicoccus sp.]|nr:hypothetical protein [Granulosicoccus sp.]
MPLFRTKPLTLTLALLATFHYQPGIAETHLPIERLSLQRCQVELDAAVALLSNETARNIAVERATGAGSAELNRAAMDSRLAELESRCPPMPQLAHNRGVLAARASDWPDAIDHFERSLQQDRRAAQTFGHLRQIFEHRAAKAYASALGTPIDLPPPLFEWQSSSIENAERRAAAQADNPLQSISTLEYELFAWWQALQNSIGLAEHYVDDFSPVAIQLSREYFANRQWADMHREIAFTANDAVAVISDAFHNRTLLLLRLVGHRWKIYQETRL